MDWNVFLSRQALWLATIDLSIALRSREIVRPGQT